MVPAPAVPRAGGGGGVREAGGQCDSTDRRGRAHRVPLRRSPSPCASGPSRRAPRPPVPCASGGGGGSGRARRSVGSAPAPGGRLRGVSVRRGAQRRRPPPRGPRGTACVRRPQNRARGPAVDRGTAVPRQRDGACGPGPGRRRMCRGPVRPHATPAAPGATHKSPPETERHRRGAPRSPESALPCGPHVLPHPVPLRNTHATSVRQGNCVSVGISAVPCATREYPLLSLPQLGRNKLNPHVRRSQIQPPSDHA